jgi:hypothetical protein
MIDMPHYLAHTLYANIHRWYVGPILCAVFLLVASVKVPAATINYDYLQCKPSECPLWKDKIAFGTMFNFHDEKNKITNGSIVGRVTRDFKSLSEKTGVTVEYLAAGDINFAFVWDIDIHKFIAKNDAFIEHMFDKFNLDPSVVKEKSKLLATESAEKKCLMISVVQDDHFLFVVIFMEMSNANECIDSEIAHAAGLGADVSSSAGFEDDLQLLSARYRH